MLISLPILLVRYRFGSGAALYLYVIIIITDPVDGIFHNLGRDITLK